jgi:hypothetical protein
MTTPRRIPGLPDSWQDFGLSVIFVIVFPLIPIFSEWWHTGAIQGPTLWLAGAMYAISIGVFSSSRLLFGLAVLASLVMASKYGFEVSALQSNLPQDSGLAPTLVMVVVAGLHMGERYNIHVVDRRRFFEF